MIRKHIIAHGRVQSVGLRFTVEMEVQGLDHRVELFLQELSSDRPGGNRFIRIDKLDITNIPSVNVADEKGFRARY